MGLLIGQSLSSLWAFPIITQIFLFFDSIIYMLAEYAFRIFELGAFVNYGSINYVFTGLMSRVKSLVTVFMLFRIAAIFIRFLIEPDKFQESGTGGSKIIVNVFVVLALLAVVYSRLLFGILGDIQILIFPSEGAEFEILDDLGFKESDNESVLANIISGVEGNISNYGRRLAVHILGAFLYHDSEATTDSWFEYGEYLSVDGTINCNIGNSVKRTLCYIANTKEGSFIFLNSLDTNQITYYPIVSTVAGIYLIFTFIKYALAVLVRSIKLFVLQIIAPIAIVAYLDPTKGEEVFKKYWKVYIKTFLDLFIKLLLVYLAVVLIELGLKGIFATSLFENVDFFTKMLMKVLFIFAILRFIKIAPDLIADIFGFSIDKEGKGQFGKTLRGIVGTGIGLGVGLSSARSEGLGGASTAFQGLSGAIQGGRSGVASTGIRDFISRQGQTNAGIRNRSGNIGDLGGMRGYVGSYTDQFTGRTRNLQKIIDDTNAYDSNINSFMDSFKNQFANTNDTATGRNYGTLDDYVNNDSSVMYERLAERQLQDEMAAGTIAIDQTQLEYARQARITAENNAKDQYNNYLNQKLDEAINDNTKFDDTTRAAYEKMKSNPRRIQVTRDPTTGIYKSNEKDLKRENARARAEAQAKIRNRSNNNNNNS